MARANSQLMVCACYHGGQFMDKHEACMIVTMISIEGDEDNGCLLVFQSWGVFIIVMCSTGGFTMLKSGTELSAKWVGEWIPRG